MMDQQLAKTEYLAGEQYTIADIAVFPWVAYACLPGEDSNRRCSDRHMISYRVLILRAWNAGVDYKTLYPNLAKWFAKIYARPAVKKGLAVPEVSPMQRVVDNDAEFNIFLEESYGIIAKANEDAKK